MIKKGLKIVEKLPIVQVGNIFNIFWSNGSYEKPSNAILLSEIRDNFIRLIAKIDWTNGKSTGMIKLEGDFNYLVVDEGEFYFLEKIRIVDVKREIFIYACELDITMTMLHNPKWRIGGTLIKTLDEDVLTRSLDFTKPLIEDCDEHIVLPLKEDELLPKTRDSYKKIDLDNFSKAKVFSTKKLAWFIEHLTNTDANDLFRKYLNDKGPIKLFFKCNFDGLIPQKYILGIINRWLQEGDLSIGTPQSNEISGYSPKLQGEVAAYSKLYVLSKTAAISENLQPKNLIKVDLTEGKRIADDYFSDVNEIIPLDPTTGELLFLNNRHVFDMLEDDDFVESSTSQFSSYYELLPRAYTTIKDFSNNNSAVVSEPLLYNISLHELEEKGHLTDEKETSKDGVSILNNIPISYYPDWWHGKSWTEQSLKRLEDSIQNTNPVIGFILFEIYDYWKNTRGADITRRFFNIYTKTEKLRSINIVTGLRLYDKNDSKSKIDLLVDSDEGFKKFTKSSKNNINFGLVSSQECKLLKNPIDILNSYTFSDKPLEIINKEFSKNFSCSFIANYNGTASLVRSKKTFDLTTSTISGNSQVEDVDSKTLFKHCYKNYEKIREISTIREEFNLTEELEKGDCFWSNVSWVFFNKLNKQKIIWKEPIIALLFAPEEDLLGGYDVRFSKITPLPMSKKLWEFENCISFSGDIQTDIDNELYPWVVYEKDKKLKPASGFLQTEVQRAGDERKKSLKALLKKFIDDMDNRFWHGDPNYFQDYYAFSKGYDDTRVYGFKEIKQLVEKEIDSGNIVNMEYEECCALGTKGGDAHFYVNYFWRVARNAKGIFSFGEAVKQWSRVYFTTYGGVIIATWWFGHAAGYEFYDEHRYYLRFWGEIRNYWWEWKGIDDLYKSQTTTWFNYDKNDFYKRFELLFSPSSKVHSDFITKLSNHGYKTTFSSSSRGCLGKTLFDIYENKDVILLKQDGLDSYWTDVREEDLKKKDSTGSTKKWIFKLSSKSSSDKKSVLKGYVLIKWNEKDNIPIIQVLLTDYKKVKSVSSKILSPTPDSLINKNIYQCINQKNYFYAWGKKIPIKGKLFRPNISDYFQISKQTIEGGDGRGMDIHRLKIETPLETIDTKIMVPKRSISLGQASENYIDLERLKLEISEREDKKVLDISAREERARLLNQELSNAKEELDWQSTIGPVSVATNALTSTARVARFGKSYPLSATLLGVSGIASLTRGIMEHQHNMEVGERDLKQMDTANSFTIAHEKNVLDNRHQYEERREKLKIIELRSNYSEWNAGDFEEIKAYNKLLFDDEETNFGFIHQRPKEGGALMDYIISYYSRYGVDVFLANFYLSMENFFGSNLSVYKFDTIDYSNIPDISMAEKIKKMFINGVKLIKTKYVLERPKLTFDDSVKIKEGHEIRKKIEDSKLLLQARDELDAELKDAVRIARDDLNTANALYQELEKEKKRLESKIAEMEASGCTEEGLAELEKTKKDLEKHKDSASLLSEQKMALEEQVTSLTNQLTLEKRKVQSGDQQIINAGKSNAELLKKLAAANAAKTQAEASKALAEETREQAIQERDACNTAANLVREELAAEKKELEAKKKELQECQESKEKEKVVCVDGLNEDQVFNDYVDRIEDLIESMTAAWRIIIDQINTRTDSYTYLGFTWFGKDVGYRYSNEITIKTGGGRVYASYGDNLSSWITSTIDNYPEHRNSWLIVGDSIILYKNNSVNGTIAYVQDNTVYHPPWCLIKHGGLLISNYYTGFYIRVVTTNEKKETIEQRKDTNFFSSVVGHILTAQYGIFLAYHKEYIKICKQFKQWEAKVDYLNKNKIPVIEKHGFYNAKTPSGQVRFDKSVYFNRTNIST